MGKLIKSFGGLALVELTEKERQEKKKRARKYHKDWHKRNKKPMNGCKWCIKMGLVDKK